MTEIKHNNSLNSPLPSIASDDGDEPASSHRRAGYDEFNSFTLPGEHRKV
jgi:hypothetical protein